MCSANSESPQEIRGLGALRLWARICDYGSFCLSVSLSYNARGVRMRVMTSIVYTLLNRGEDANNDRW